MLPKWPRTPRPRKSFDWLPKNLVTLLFGISVLFFFWVLLIITSGCSTPSRRLETCTIDSENQVFYCDGSARPWKDLQMKDYVCHKIENWEAYIGGCR